MKLVCTKSNLQKAISIVLKAVPSKTTMPILECIVIKAEHNKITLIANDLDLGIETELVGDILSSGTVALEAKMFSEMVRKLPDSDVSIETNDDTYETIIICEKARFKISGKSTKEFTFLPEIEKSNPVTLSQFTLKEIIRQTIFSVAERDTNKMMTGELFEIIDNELKAVSLDGHRISIRKVELKEKYDTIKEVIPGKTLTEIAKILSGNIADEVNLYFTSNHLLFEFDDTIVVSRLLEGKYFQIEHMLSSDYETKVQINRNELYNCIDRATLLIHENDKKPIILDIKDDSVSLIIQSVRGSMDEEIAINKEGKNLMIGFNPKLLLDALRVIDDEEIDLYFLNAKAACYIRDMAGSYTYLILPINFVPHS